MRAINNSTVEDGVEKALLQQAKQARKDLLSKVLL